MTDMTGSLSGNFKASHRKRLSKARTRRERPSSKREPPFKEVEIHVEIGGIAGVVVPWANHHQCGPDRLFFCRLPCFLITCLSREGLRLPIFSKTQPLSLPIRTEGIAVRRCGFGRTYEHHRFITNVEVSWSGPDGKRRSALGNTIDISVHGMQVEVNASIPADCSIQVRFAGIELSSKASVRHCAQICSWFRMGLEFEDSLLEENIPMLIRVLTDSGPRGSLSDAVSIHGIS